MSTYQETTTVKTKKQLAEIEMLRRHVAEERKWFYEEHGGTLGAYIERYGEADDPDRYGDGGPAIYAADREALERKERALEQALAR